MADDTITVNMMPSCGQCKKQSDYAGYKKYTKTWKNLCTSTTCNSKTPGTLQNNPKGTYEGELTCSKCDSDYCGFCGTEKSGSARFKLVAANASTEDNTTEDTGDSASTYDDMVKDLLKPLDGEVEYRVEGDKVYVNKIPIPEEATELWLREGVNITNEGVTIHDYNPDTPNFFVFSWGEKFDKKFVIKIPTLIDRFGPKIKEINCTKKVLEWTQDSSSTSSTDSTGTNADGTSTTSTATTTGTSSSSSGTSTARKTRSTSSSNKSKGSSNSSKSKPLYSSGGGGVVRKAKSDDWGKDLISWISRKIRGK